MFDLLWVPNFIKIGANFTFETNSNQCISNYQVRFVLSANIHKNRAHCSFETKSTRAFYLGSKCAISNIILMINKLDDLPWLPDSIALGDIFHFWDHIFLEWGDWYLSNNAEVCYLAVILVFLVDTWLLLLVTYGYCSLPNDYCSLPNGYCSLPNGYCSLPLVTARSYF